jgi:hypothetical protein
MKFEIPKEWSARNAATEGDGEVGAGIPPADPIEKPTVYIHNDGKERDQSFKAWTDVFEWRGFGCDQNAAIAEHIYLIRGRIARLQAELASLEAGNMKIVPVDAFGNPRRDPSSTPPK